MLRTCCSQWSSVVLTTPWSIQRQASFYSQCEILIFAARHTACKSYSLQQFWNGGYPSPILHYVVMEFRSPPNKDPITLHQTSDFSSLVVTSQELSSLCKLNAIPGSCLTLFTAFDRHCCRQSRMTVTAFSQNTVFSQHIELTC